MKIITGIVIAFLLAYALGIFSFDTNRVLIEDVVLIREEGAKTLQLDFSAPVRIVGSFPESTGDIAQIKLRVIAFGRFSENLSLLEKYIGIEEAKELHMTNLRYEGDVPGGPFLVMKFSKPVKWTLTEGEGLLGMNIAIEES